MNKQKNLIAVVALLLLGMSAKAQDNIYPHYGFWSNWKLGAEAIYNHQYGNGDFFDWRHATDAGFGIVLEKELNHVWDVRLHGAMPGLFTNEKNLGDGTWYDRYGKLTADVKFSINDAIMGYNPERRFSIYALAGAGFESLFRIERYGNLAVLWQGGLGISQDFGKHGTMYAEYVVDNTADIPDFHYIHDLHGSVAVGLMYRFGPTTKDAERIANEKKFDQEELNALYNKVDQLNGELNDAQQEEGRLNQRVGDLEQQLADANAALAAAANNNDEELDAAINGIADDNVAFRALPFSVLFANDSYAIAADQMEKIQAVADVMKQNPELRLSVVGYCDYTASEEYNQKLSERRANAVKDQLIKLGVEESRLTDYGKGKTTAFGDLKSGVNRRVSFYRIVE